MPQMLTLMQRVHTAVPWATIQAVFLAVGLFPSTLFGQVAIDASIEAVVDHYVDMRLRESMVEPASQAIDSDLIRRLTLDLVGRLPSLCETQEFLASVSESKRALWVDRLMMSEGFVRHQVDELESLLMYPDRGNLRDYLKKSVTENRPWDQIFKDLMLAEQGDDPNAGASSFVRARLNDVDKMTNEVSVRFFGVNISCAQCHDHPLVSDWKQDQYYGMKSFFARTFENGGFVAERPYGTVDYVTTYGEQRRARLVFLTGQALDEPEQLEPSDQEKQAEKKQLEELRKEKKAPPQPIYSRRNRIIESGLSPVGRMWLARAIVNRVWYRLLGYGLVMPVDQMHSENPASHPELLEWLAEDLIAHDFDLRHLIRGLVMSRTYSRDTSWEGSGTKPEASLFAIGRVRMLTPLQLGASLRVATLDPESIGGNVPLADRNKRLEDSAQSGRGLSSRFEMPREDLQLSISEALYLNNNRELMSELLGRGLVDRLVAIQDDGTAMELAFQSVLQRPPDSVEREAIMSYLQMRSERRLQAYQQMVWSLLASTEFRFNH